MAKLISIYQSLPHGIFDQILNYDLDIDISINVPRRTFESDTKVAEKEYSFCYTGVKSYSSEDITFAPIEQDYALVINRYCSNCSCIGCMNAPEKLLLLKQNCKKDNLMKN